MATPYKGNCDRRLKISTLSRSVRRMPRVVSLRKWAWQRPMQRTPQETTCHKWSIQPQRRQRAPRPWMDGSANCGWCYERLLSCGFVSCTQKRRRAGNKYLWSDGLWCSWFLRCKCRPPSFLLGLDVNCKYGYLWYVRNHGWEHDGISAAARAGLCCSWMHTLRRLRLDINDKQKMQLY